MFDLAKVFGANLESIALGVALLAPGVLISYFRNTFITGRHPKISEKILEHLFISAVYFSSVGAIFFFISYWNWITALLLLFLLPSAIGLFFGIAAQRRWLDCLFEKLKLNPIHPATTGWDFMFGTMSSNKWMIITLADGTKVRGWFDRNSGASTDLSRRDIFLHDVRRDDYSRFEEDGRARGIWIREDEIKQIEIISD